MTHMGLQKLNRDEAILITINLLQDILLKVIKCGRKYENDMSI